ncbi:MAG: hypothetical protein ABJZ56_19925 [Paracoccaceae bacterium]
MAKIDIKQHVAETMDRRFCRGRPKLLLRRQAHRDTETHCG